MQIEEIEEIDDPDTSPNIGVKVSASFPSSEIFGIKLINGHPTKVLLSFSNGEPEAITVVFIGGSLWTSQIGSKEPEIVRNLTTAKYNVEIGAGKEESVSYSFATELRPQDLKLNLAAVIKDNNGTPHAIQAFNEIVSIVEPDTSFFDPQMWVQTHLALHRS